jgi:hypothetical protein
MTVYRVTRNGKPQGPEYKFATEAAAMGVKLSSSFPEFTFGWVACESDSAVLDPDWFSRQLDPVLA